MGAAPGWAPSGFFALRTPLLAFDEILDLARGLEAPTAIDDGERLEEAVEHDRRILRQRLGTIAARPEVREAVFLGSPDLEAGIASWEADPHSRRSRGIERALVRYVLRMAGRPTPFGLFAGCSVAGVGERTRLVIEARPRYRRHSRLDMGYLGAVAEAVVKAVVADPGGAPRLVYRPNSSLYRIAGRVRYVEARWDGEKRSHHLVTVNGTASLAAALARASTGATASQLTAVLNYRGRVRAEAEAEHSRLVASQVLVPDAGPVVTGPEPLGPLVEDLGAAGAEPTGTSLQEVGRALTAIDDTGLGTPPERYRELARSLEDMPAAFDLRRLFQVDMLKPAPAARLGADVVDEILRGVCLLHRLLPAAVEHGAGRSGDTALDQFVRAFQDRFDARQVPLVEALDGDLGVGFGATRNPTPLLDGLAFPDPAAASVTWGKREDWLLRALVGAAARGDAELALDQADAEAMADGERLPLPDAFSAMATVSAVSDEELDRGRFQVVLWGASGPSGAELLGRFCHADPVLAGHVGRHLQAEEALDPDAVHAEIVHLPQGRVGNILLRPVFRGYEIPFLGRSGAPENRQIPVTDLLVSVHGGRVVLRSARLGGRVVPRLTSAHNYSARAVPVYRFLCALQAQGTVGSVTWQWGPLAAAPFLPRVRSGRLVLSLARWRLARDELRRLGRVEGAERFRVAQTWRAERGVPRLCTLVDADNKLPVDFENVVSVEAFVHLVLRRDAAVLEELFPGPTELCASGPEGRFVHEMVVPFVRTAAGTTPPPPVAASPSGFSRTFPPGSEWLYVKLYSATSIQDDVLRALRPVVRGALEDGAVDRWFFVRYADPHPHLRLRLHGDPAGLDTRILPRLEEAVVPLMADGRVWRFEIGTYEREVERYGGVDAIALCEQAFHADSEATAGIVLRLSRGDEGGDQRWRLTLRGMDMLLSDLGLDLDAKVRLLRQLRASSAREHRVDGGLESTVSARFRRERSSLERLLDPSYDPASPLEPGLARLRGRSAQMAPIARGLQELDRAGRLGLPLGELAVSLLHMHANRLLRTSHRAQELVLYDFLLRLLQSRAARRPPA